MLRILLITYKTCYQVGETYYTTGGTPDEFNTLASAFKLHIITAVQNERITKPSWKALDSSICFHPIEPIKQIATYPPPYKSMKESINRTIEVITNYKIDVAYLKGPSEISFAPINEFIKKNIPIIYHYSLDWLEDVEVSSQKSLLRRMLKPYFKYAYNYRKNLLLEVLPKVDLVGTVSNPYLEKLKLFNPKRLTILQDTFTTSLNDLNENPKAHNERNNFLYVGRIDTNKNLSLIVKAISHLKKEQSNIPFGVNIVGNGDALPEIKKLVKCENLENFIFFHNYRQADELRLFYENALATILPSFSETLGKVLIESLSAGTPILASKVGGIVDILKDGENGHFISNTDPSDLATQMIKYYSGGEKYTKLVQNCISSVRHFCREETLQKWKDLFAETANIKASR